MSERSDKWSALIAEVRAKNEALEQLARAFERLTEGEDIHELADLKARLKDAEQALEEIKRTGRFEVVNGNVWHKGQFERHPTVRDGCAPCVAHGALDRLRKGEKNESS